MRRLCAHYITLIALLTLCMGCGERTGESANQASSPPAIFTVAALPPPPSRTATDFKWLPGDVFETVCRMGHPIAVLGWDLDPETRFVYFAGPFVADPDTESALFRDYMYQSIPGPDRRSVSTSLMVNVSGIDLALQKPAELNRYLLPQLTAVRSNISENIQLLGEPSLIYQHKTGQQRYIFARKFCLGEQLLEGIYLDVDAGRVVKAKGIEHPERLKWLLSRNRPPEPDTKATHYLDVRPREGSPQAAAIGFIEVRERGDEDRTRERVWEEQALPDRIDLLVKPTRPGAQISYGELTYQTTRYELDEAEVEVRYAMYTNLDDEIPVKATLVLRKRDDEWWVVR